MQTFQIQNGDLAIAGKNFAMITGIPKLVQDLTMGLVESYGSDPFHLGWGSTLQSYIGMPNAADVQAMVRSEVARVIQNKQAVQLNQMQRAANKGQPNPMSVNEVISSIKSLSVSTTTDQVRVAASIITAGGTSVPLQTGVRG